MNATTKPEKRVGDPLGPKRESTSVSTPATRGGPIPQGLPNHLPWLAALASMVLVAISAWHLYQSETAAYREAEQDAAPTHLAAFHERPGRYEFWGGSTVFALVVGWLVFLLVRQPVHLRRTAEQATALRASEDRFKAFFDHSPTFVSLKDLEGRYLFANRGFRESHGMTASDFRSKRTVDVFPAFEAAALGKQDQYVLEKRGPIEHEMELTAGEGRQRMMLVVKFPVLDADDEVTAIGTVSLDITDRKQAERRLRQNQARFRSWFEQASDITTVYSPDGAIQFQNPTLEKPLGFTADEIIGRKLRDLVHPDDTAKIDEAFRRAVASPGTVVTTEYRHLHKNGTWRIIESSRKAIAEGGVVSEVVANARDITERKQAEYEREHLIAELESKNDELEAYAYTVSHDLKSPLVTIEGFVGLMEQDMERGDREQLRSDAAQVHTAIGQMQRLLDELLTLSRVGRRSEPWQRISLSTLVDDRISQLATLLADRRIEVAVSEPMPAVRGDPLRLSGLIQNLLENAIKFMGDQSAPRIEIDAWQDADSVVCRVRDNGRGIDPRYHEKVFGTFDRLDTDTEGTGIGLAIVKRVAELHEGRAWVESDGDGAGSSFFFTLPADRGPEQASRLDAA